MTYHPQENEIVAMLRDGLPAKAVARKLNITAHYAYKIRNAHGIPGYYADPNGPACRRGHAWPEHLGTRNDGRHTCLECRRENGRKAKAADQLAIELAVAGQPTRLRPHERRLAVRELLTRNLSGDQMAKRIGCTPRTIWRIRKELREAA